VTETPDLVTVTIDGIDIPVPKGTLVIRAAEEAGIAIPRFCDHPLLDPVGACRQCLVEITDAGNGRGFPMPQASCTTVAAQGMQVKTGATSDKAKAANEGILELLLINHPLDCPICDKGGECPLQNQAMANGSLKTRYDGVKRSYPKPKRLSPQILLDRERCVLCTRCTRFADQIAGDDQIGLAERGAKSQITCYDDQPFTSYFAGNVVQICPVGALTSEAYRFSARPFDLVSTVTTCEGCAAGCQLRVDTRHGSVRRRQAGNLPAVNEEWTCDRGRFGFVSGHGDDRLTTPLVRHDGELAEATWPEALAAAAAGLAKAGGRVGVITGGRLTKEAAAAYARLARDVLGTEDIDCRVRAISDEETEFLSHVILNGVKDLSGDPGDPETRSFAGAQEDSRVTYDDLEHAHHVVLVGLEPEDECPILFLRLRKANRKQKVKVTAIAPYLSRGSAKLGATLVATVPGQEANALAQLDLDADTIVLGGERLATSPGALQALAGVTTKGARYAWVPRRPGEIGAIQAGAFPVQGRDTLAQLAALQAGELQAIVLAAVDLSDLPDPDAAAAALDAGAFVDRLEQRLSEAAQLADVVLPVALLEETSGTFVNWEGRELPVRQVVQGNPMSEVRVVAALADVILSDGEAVVLSEAKDLSEDPTDPQDRSFAGAQDDGSAVILASHRELLDDARLLDHATALLECARPVVARVNPKTAQALGLAAGDRVALGGVTFDLVIDESVADKVIWAPAEARGQELRGVRPGQVVAVSKEVAA
jgi:NADH-quinone oxidoreductase subunit G